MELDDRYIEALSSDDVRVKGTRVGVEHVLSAYLDGALPEEIGLDYPTLTLEQIHGTIAWYLRHRERIDRYLAERVAQGRQALRRQADRTPAEVVQRLRRRMEVRVGE